MLSWRGSESAEFLGRGGFAEVWKAHHHIWVERKVAVKIPSASATDDDLLKEGLIHARLEHPGIARTVGIDVTADPPYFITEFVPGCTLREALDTHGRFSPEEVRGVMDQMGN